MGTQLWMEASSTFSLPGFTDHSGIGRWSAAKLRVLFWPSGAICWQVNLYLISMRKSGLAVSTINTYASELSVFIKFLYSTKTLLEDIDDDLLVDYSDSLICGDRSGTHINRLLLRVINYLIWYQQLFPKISLIGLPGTGCCVTISRRIAHVKAGIIQGKIQHMAMVPMSVPRTVRPISHESLEKLVAACSEVSSSRFKKDRDRCMLVLLADAGLRREELTWIRCDRIREATKNGGRLRIRTSKRRGNPEREIPIPQETLSSLLEYLDVARAIQVRRIKKRAPEFQDEGWAFCTGSGKKMAPVTVSQIFSDLRSHACIKGRATAHMFRHRYITLQVLSRLQAVKKKNIGLEAMTTILSKIASLSGHGSIRSLWTYVDWAYDELDAMKASIEVSTSDAGDVINRLLARARDLGDTKTIEVLELVINAIADAKPSQPSLNVVTHSFRREK